MGKVVSIAAKIASPFVSIINPAVGVALAATAAASDVVVADRMRRKLNTEVDERLGAQERAALLEEEQRLQENLAVVKKLYNEHYVTLLHNQAMMEEYYLTIKVELERENVIIDNLPEVLELLDLCARGEGNKVIPKLEKYREQIGVLLRWGLMHIVVLAGDDVICREILKLSNNIIDCLEMDYLGHTILEYAHLLGNHQLVHDLKDSTRLLQQAKAIQSARLFLSQRKIPYWTENTPNLPDLGSYIDSYGNEETLLEALIIVGAFPKEPEHWENLVFKIIELNKPTLLKKFLYHSYGCIRADFIAKIMQRYPEPRNYNQINSIDLIKGFGYLHQQGFKDFNEVHPISKLNPLETAIIAGEQQHFIKLLICGAKLSQRNLVGETPLMIAIRSKNFDVARHLVEVRRVDPRIYNHTINAKALLPKEQLHLSMALKERIKEKQEQEQLQLKTFKSTVSVIGIDFIEQISGYYNLWISGQLSSDYARTPIVLGMYVLGIKQSLPFTEKELGWIASQLGLRCEFNGKEFGNKDGGLVKILAKDNGYIAEFEGKQVEAFEPEIQYSSTISNHFYAHLPTGTNKPDQNKYNQLKLYINNSALMLENFLTTQQKNSKLLIKNREFYQYAGYTRFEELSKSLALIAKPSDYNGENIHFNYCYYLPECDAGYQAIGVSRLTAAKLILDNLSDSEIFASIKVEWVHWVLSFYQLPEELSNISGLAEVLAMHHEAKLSLQSDPNNFRYLSQLEKSIKSLCLLASVGNCIEYLAKVVAAPHNHINALKYYQAEGQLNAGGVLVALAKLLKFNVRIWEEDEGGVNCIFDYIKDNRFATIDLLKLSKIDNQLDKVGLLSNNKDLNIKPVVTHIDLFRSIDPDSDLGAILHGWFIATNNKLGLMPENDLLVLLLKVKATLIGRTDYDYIRGAKHFRNILSKDLMEIFSEDFNNLDNLDSYWGEVADFRVRGYARDALLQEHCNLNASYKGQVSFLQHKLKAELEDKLARADQEHEDLMENFAANLKKLEDWQEQQTLELQTASEQQKQVIISTFQRQLAIEHSAVKRQARKSMRGSIVNFVVNRITAKIFPPKVPIAQGMMQGAVVNVTSSLLASNKIDLRGMVASSISYGITQGMNFQEDLTKIAIRGMAEGLITGIVLNKSGQDIWQRSLCGAVQGICDFGITHHMKFSDSYTQEIFRGSINGILEGVKNGETQIDQVLILAAERIANNIKQLEERLSSQQNKKTLFAETSNSASAETSNINLESDEASSSNSNGSVAKSKVDPKAADQSLVEKDRLDNVKKAPRSIPQQPTRSKQQGIIDKYGLMTDSNQYQDQQQQPNKTQQLMRSRFPKIAAFSDAWNLALEEGRYRDEGAHQVAASIPEALVAIGTGNLAVAGAAADNAVTGLWQMVTNKKESSLMTQGIEAIGEKTGLYDPSKAQILSTAFNIGVMGVSGLSQKSKSMLYALDLTTRATSTKVGSGLANSMFSRTSGLKNTTALGKAISSVSILPRLTPQQALNSGLTAGIAIFGARATKETIDIIQEFRRKEPGGYSLPGFMPQPNAPTIYTTPKEQKEPTIFTTPVHHSSGTALQGPAVEVKKPIIFSGGIDYKDKEFLDSLNELEKVNPVTPGMFETMKPQVKWTGADTFTWHGLEGRVKVGGNVKIDHTQVHHIIPQGIKKEKAYEVVEAAGFDLEDDANKIVLPTKEGARISGIDSAIHEGGHNKEYTDEVTEQLKRVKEQAKRQGWDALPKEEFQAKCQQEIKARIGNIRTRLESGDLAVNKNGSNKLNNAPKPEAGN